MPSDCQLDYICREAFKRTGTYFCGALALLVQRRCRVYASISQTSRSLLGRSTRSVRSTESAIPSQKTCCHFVTHRTGESKPNGVPDMSRKHVLRVVVDPVSGDEDESEVKGECDPPGKRAEEEGEERDLRVNTMIPRTSS